MIQIGKEEAFYPGAQFIVSLPLLESMFTYCHTLQIWLGCTLFFTRSVRLETQHHSLCHQKYILQYVGMLKEIK